MGRLLLSQGQVTVVLSSGLIALFTLLLFLSGYVYQQRSIVGIKTALRPNLPKPPPSIAAANQQPTQPSIQPSRILGSKNREGGHVAFTDFRASARDGETTVDWNRLGHVQIVRTHHDMCNAIMVLAELHRLKSPARRVLLFPQAWAAEKLKKAGKGEISDPTLDISRRLMKAAARRYGVELRPITPLLSTEGGLEGGDMETYSLASAFALTDFDRVLSIETPGLIVDAEPLDAVLAFTEAAPFAMLHDTVKGDGVHGDDLYLLQPSMDVYQALRQTLGEQDSFNDTLLSSAFGDPLLLNSGSKDDDLVRSIGTLHDAAAIDPNSVDEPTFNATAFLSGVSYIRFSDPKLPGPEYDVPWADKVAARPENKDADWTWTKLYGQFEQKRMEVCGLGLETWRP